MLQAFKVRANSIEIQMRADKRRIQQDCFFERKSILWFQISCRLKILDRIFQDLHNQIISDTFTLPLQISKFGTTLRRSDAATLSKFEVQF